MSWYMADVTYCSCKNEYETCSVCAGPAPTPSPSARERFERELARARTRRVKTTGNAIPVPVDDDQPRGYHIAEIPRGVFGQSSKILEEVLELQDAEAQGAKIMALHELSDIVGAVHGYLREHYPSMKFEDLVTMCNLTRRAFESGSRK